MQAHDEIAALLRMPVVSLELVDPRFYHLDTALAVLDDTTIAFYPPAFSDESQATLRELFPDAIEVTSADAYVLGLNVVSDGLNVVMPAAAIGFAEQLRKPDSGRSASICPSCSRAADPSNAAHWRYIRDRRSTP